MFTGFVQSLLPQGFRSADEPGLSGLDSIAVVVLLATTWVSWRIWAFTIRPVLYPREPKEFPYSIPLIGHAIGFYKDSEGTFSRAREYFNNTREPFALTLAGQQMYVVTSPHDVSAIYKNVTTLTFDEFVRDMMVSLGTSPDGMTKAWRKPDGQRKVLVHIAEDVYRKQFLPGDRLVDLWISIQQNISASLQWSSIPNQALLAETENTKTLSLWLWCRHALIQSVTTAIFGEHLFKLEPRLTEIFAAFDDNSWKLTYKLPAYAARDMHEAKDQIKSTLKRYLQLPSDQRPRAAWVIGELEGAMRSFCLSDHDISVLFTMPLWVINSNAYKLCFWIMAHLLHNPALYSVIRAEIEPAVSQGLQGLDARLEQCHRLVAIYHEMLRLNTASASIRGISADTNIGNVTLKAGGKVLVPYRQLHMDQAFWGNDAEEFNAERFLNSKNLNKSSSFRPFGGGTTYCAGTHVAFREILSFVALSIYRFDVRLANGEKQQGVPTADKRMPSLGVIPPLKGQDVRVILTRSDI